MPLTAFLTSRRIGRWAIGGDAILKYLVGLSAACFFATAGFYTGSKGFARRRMALIQASRFVIALIRQAALEERMGTGGALLLAWWFRK